MIIRQKIESNTFIFSSFLVKLQWWRLLFQMIVKIRKLDDHEDNNHEKRHHYFGNIFQHLRHTIHIIILHRIWKNFISNFLYSVFRGKKKNGFFPSWCEKQQRNSTLLWGLEILFLFFFFFEHHWISIQNSHITKDSKS